MSLGMLYLAGVGLAVLALLCACTFARSTAHGMAIALVAAALIYVGFAVEGRVGPGGLALELIGTALFGSLALAAMRVSAWWLVTGWALHAGWDVGLHLLGPASGTAPEWYSHLCVAFDLVVAGYFAWHLLRSQVDRFSKSTPVRGAE